MFFLAGSTAILPAFGAVQLPPELLLHASSSLVAASARADVSVLQVQGKQFLKGKLSPRTPHSAAPRRPRKRENGGGSVLPRSSSARGVAEVQQQRARLCSFPRCCILPAPGRASTGAAPPQAAADGQPAPLRRGGVPRAALRRAEAPRERGCESRPDSAQRVPRRRVPPALLRGLVRVLRQPRPEAGHRSRCIPLLVIAKRHIAPP